MERVVYEQVAARIQPKDISDNEYKEFERKLEKINGMKKKGRPQLIPRVPTPKQATWLNENYKLYSRAVLMKKMKISEKTYYYFMRHLGLMKKRGPFKIDNTKPSKEEPTPPKEIIRYVPPPKLERPRADHTNITQEQRINYWINYPI